MVEFSTTAPTDEVSDCNNGEVATTEMLSEMAPTSMVISMRTGSPVSSVMPVRGYRLKPCFSTSTLYSPGLSKGSVYTPEWLLRALWVSPVSDVGSDDGGFGHDSPRGIGNNP